MQRIAWIVFPFALGCSSDPTASSADPGESGTAGSSAAEVVGGSGGGGGSGESEDASAPDAGSPDEDAALDATDEGFYGTSRCDTADVELCDGFESGEIDLAIWSVNAPPGNAITIDDQHVARGKLALHVSASKAAQTRTHIRENKTFPAAKNSFYGRAFVYMEEVPINNFNLFASDGDDGDFNLGGQVKPLGDPTGTSWIRFSTHPLHTSSLSTTPVPSKEWHCWEWYFDGDGESELRAWLDEVPLDDMTVNGGTSAGTWVAPAFDNLSFGFHHPHPEPSASYEVWFDEVAVDAKRIGCKR